jgi:hypothetical protein
VSQGRGRRIQKKMVHMKKVLVVYFSQTGQLERIIRSVMAPFERRADIQVTWQRLEPLKPYPFPWPLVRFFDQFPECAHLDPPPLKPMQFDPNADYDLIVLGYQPWYLSPSPPTTAFLKSPEGRAAMRGKPVVTVLGCRNMWLMAQEAVRKLVKDAGGRLVDKIALVDRASPSVTFITTPVWLLTGTDGSVGGIFPPAGVDDSAIKAAAIQGEKLVQGLADGRLARGEAVLDPAVAAPVNASYVVSEMMGLRSFKIWGWIVRLAGKQGSLLRIPLLTAYVLFLGTAIALIVPITVLARWVLSFLPPYRRWLRGRVAHFEHYGPA